jgi:hypothetical protein
MNIGKILIVNGCLLIYCLYIIGEIIKPKGLIYNTYIYYKKIKKIQRTQKKNQIKTQYYRWLINEYKQKNRDIIELISFMKYNNGSNDYQRIVWPKKIKNKK